MPTLIVYGLMALALAGTVGAGVHYVKAWGANEVRAEWSEATRLQKALEEHNANQAASNLEADRAAQQTIYKTITQTVDQYIDRPIYHAECLDPDGLRDANRSLLGTLADPAKPDATVPAPKPSG